MMVSNMSDKSDEAGCNVDDDEEVLVPRPHYYTIWDCPHLNKVTVEENGVVKNGWQCNWCMNPPAMFSTFSATKALAHVLRLPGSDVRPCTGIILETFALGYKDLHARKMEAGRSRSSKKIFYDRFHSKHPEEDSRCNVGGKRAERWRSIGGYE
jgi:hypothetical protein